LEQLDDEEKSLDDQEIVVLVEEKNLMTHLSQTHNSTDSQHMASKLSLSANK